VDCVVQHYTLLHSLMGIITPRQILHTVEHCVASILFYVSQVSVVHVCEATLTKRLIEFENTDAGSLTVCLFLP